MVLANFYDFGIMDITHKTCKKYTKARELEHINGSFVNYRHMSARKCKISEYIFPGTPNSHFWGLGSFLSVFFFFFFSSAVLVSGR